MSADQKPGAACDHHEALAARTRFCIECGQDLTRGDSRGATKAGYESSPPPSTMNPFTDGKPSDDSQWSTVGLTVSDPRIGSILAGRYRIDSVLGEGGFGAVYRGTHIAIGEPVAIKFLHGEFASNTELRARFRREAVALARLRHPGVVSVHDFGEEQGSLYLVMELVEGVPLSQRLLDGDKTLPIPRIADLFDQLLQVLEAAHAIEIVHRDIKPDNVLLVSGGSRTEHVKVFDFGIALVDDQEDRSRLTATGMVQGTPLYMSPEQCRGRQVGPPTDVYAVGVMLYEMLAGAPPFSGEGATDLMVKHMFIDPPPMSERGLRQAVSPSLEAIVRAAMSKDPAHRPTAAAIRDALRLAMDARDPVSLADESHRQRVTTAHLSRDERGLRAATVERAATSQEVSFSGFAILDAPHVLLWSLTDARADSLTASLAVNAMPALRWQESSPPPLLVAGQKVGAIVVAGEQAAEQTRTLRSDAATKSIPILVVDVAKPEDTALMIRAGASDVTLALVGDEAVCKKLKRMLQRGR